jgi:hypothetical protein
MPTQFRTILSTKIQNFNKKLQPQPQNTLSDFFVKTQTSDSLKQLESESENIPSSRETISLSQTHPYIAFNEAFLENLFTEKPTDLFLEHISIKQFAEEWSYLDYKYFQEIPRVEYVTKLNPFWDKMLNRSNMLSRWIASEIVNNVNFGNRIYILQKIIDVMVYMWELGNFNACMCIWGGLHTFAVNRLTTTRNALSPRILNIIEVFTSRLSEAGNFAPLQAEYDIKVREQEPFVPWIELLTKNRNMASERSDYLPPSENQKPKLINFDKLRALSDQMFKFDKYQQNNDKLLKLIIGINVIYYLYYIDYERLPTVINS